MTNEERKYRNPCTGNFMTEQHKGSPYELTKDGKAKKVCIHYREGSCVAGKKHLNGHHPNCLGGKE